MRLLIAAVGLLLTGLLYYAIFRVAPGAVYDPTLGSFPSFIFVLSFSLGSAALVSGGILRRLRYPLIWLLTVLLAEMLFGVVDPLDGFAAILGFGVAAVFILKSAGSPSRPSAWEQRLLASFGLILLAGSYAPHYVDGNCCDSDKQPVYLSYNDLRSSVAVEAPRSMSAMGNLYLYANHLYINEKNKGLHIIDNADPANPKPEAFIKIPGNTNVNIRSGYLYADSFIDLVVLDIRDPDNIQEINRQIDVFPYDVYQAIEDETIYLKNLDRDRGVVIGYE